MPEETGESVMLYRLAWNDRSLRVDAPSEVGVWSDDLDRIRGEAEYANHRWGQEVHHWVEERVFTPLELLAFGIEIAEPLPTLEELFDG
tara:strand:+ start:479 stop:745 length:267 start_codon:yes stop_codon:yes gene_type:complete